MVNGELQGKDEVGRMKVENCQLLVRLVVNVRHHEVQVESTLSLVTRRVSKG